MEEFIFWCWSVGQAAQRAGDTYYNLLRSGYTMSPMIIVDHAGYNAIYYAWSGEFDDGEELVVIVPVATGDLMPARYLLSTPGMASVQTIKARSGFGTPIPLSTVKEYWQDSYVEAFKLCLEELTTASIVGPEYHEIDGAAGALLSVCATFKITTDVECFVTSTQLNAYQSEGQDEPFNQAANATVIAGVGNSSAMVSGLELDRIAQAIEDLAHKTTTVSLNNGGAIAVVDSSEVIVP